MKFERLLTLEDHIEEWGILNSLNKVFKWQDSLALMSLFGVGKDCGL